MMCCCEILVHEFWALLCPATQVLAMSRAAQSPSDATARKGSRDLSSHQYKIETCLQCEPLNTACSSLPEQRDFLNFCRRKPFGEEKPNPSGEWMEVTDCKHSSSKS